jgi:hypothetical protein
MSILDSIYEDAVEVTKSDTDPDPAGPFASLLIAAVGTIKFTTLKGHTVTLAANDLSQIGNVIKVATSRVWSTGTSGTVYGLYAGPYRGPKATAGA